MTAIKGESILNILCKQAFKGLLLFAFTIFLLGCEKASQSILPEKQIELKLVHGPDTAGLLKVLRQQFEQSKPRLPDGRIVKVMLQKHDGISAARLIAKGQVKTDLWLSPSLSLVNFVNSSLSNLGPRQSDCVRLFSTPMVIAAQAKDKAYFNRQEQQVSWYELFMSKFSKNNKVNYMAYSHSRPDSSSMGLASLIQLAYFAAVHDERVLNLDTLKSAASTKKLLSYESLVSSYSSNHNELLSRTARSSNNRVFFTLTSEQQLARFNAQHATQDSPLIAFYPREGSYWQSYAICTSDADWVGPAERAAAKKWVEFLSSKSAQFTAKKAGFRPELFQFEETAPLTKKFGIDTTQPKISFHAVPGNVVNYLLESWPKFQRPALFSLVIDTSGSMEGDALASTKEQFRKIIAMAEEKDKVALSSFATDAKLQVDATNDFKRITKELNSLRSIGGSAVYSGIKGGVDVLLEEKYKAFRKILIIITDGDDQNSQMSLSRIKTIMADRVSTTDLSVIIVAIEQTGVSHNDLKQIADVSNGFFYSSSISNLNAVFNKIIASI